AAALLRLGRVRAPQRVNGARRHVVAGLAVAPGEVQVVAAAVARVAVVAHPAERRAGAVLPGLGPLGELADQPPAAAALPVRDDVEGEPDGVLAVARVDRVE